MEGVSRRFSLCTYTARWLEISIDVIRNIPRNNCRVMRVEYQQYLFGLPTLAQLRFPSIDPPPPFFIAKQFLLSSKFANVSKVRIFRWNTLHILIYHRMLRDPNFALTLLSYIFILRVSKKFVIVYERSILWFERDRTFVAWEHRWEPRWNFSIRPSEDLPDSVNSTRRIVDHSYRDAELLGRSGGDCILAYPDCTESPLETFTEIASP